MILEITFKRDDGTVVWHVTGNPLHTLGYRLSGQVPLDEKTSRRLDAFTYNPEVSRRICQLHDVEVDKDGYCACCFADQEYAENHP